MTHVRIIPGHRKETIVRYVQRALIEVLLEHVDRGGSLVRNAPRGLLASALRHKGPTTPQDTRPFFICKG
jgi:hypothetical protein